MNRTFLKIREPLTLPVEADNISPDIFAGQSNAQLQVLPVLMGRKEVKLGDLFTIEGEGADEIVVEGNLEHVKKIGQGMTRGKILILGNAGMHTGNSMKGGEIDVSGNVGAWAGANMSGGKLAIHGNADAMLGAAYTGAKLGMRGGVIIVHGNAAIRTGELMRRGMIIVCGDTSDFTGARMIAGSIFVLGKLGGRTGAGMKRGTIVAFGGLKDGLLPTFQYACEYQPSFLRYYLRQLAQWDIPISDEQMNGIFQRYTGDINTIGKGEVLVYG